MTADRACPCSPSTSCSEPRISARSGVACAAYSASAAAPLASGEPAASSSSAAAAEAAAGAAQAPREGAHLRKGEAVDLDHVAQPRVAVLDDAVLAEDAGVFWDAGLAAHRLELALVAAFYAG